MGPHQKHGACPSPDGLRGASHALGPSPEGRGRTPCGPAGLRALGAAMRRSFLAGLGWLLLSVSGCVSPSSEAPRSDDVRASAPGVDVRTGELVEFRSGPLRLRGLLWKPAGPGAAPAVLLNHGSGEADPDRTAGMPMAEAARRLAPSFVRRGYGFFYPFRRGQGASADAGPSLQAVLAREEQAHGPEARQRLQDRLLETEQLDDVMAALAQLESVPGIDPTRVAMAGHSFGGQLTLLAADAPGGGGVRRGGCVVVTVGRGPTFAGRGGPGGALPHPARPVEQRLQHRAEHRARQGAGGQRLPTAGRRLSSARLRPCGWARRGVPRRVPLEADVLGFVDEAVRR